MLDRDPGRESGTPVLDPRTQACELASHPASLGPDGRRAKSHDEMRVLVVNSQLPELLFGCGGPSSVGQGLAVLDGAQGQAPSLQVHTLVIHLPGRRYHGERPGALRSYLIKIVAAGLGCWSE